MRVAPGPHGRESVHFEAPAATWFLGCSGWAIDGAKGTLAAVLAKAIIWEGLTHITLDDRPRLVINRLLDGLEGNLTTPKWGIDILDTRIGFSVRR
jgi:hypothetical protein